MLITFKGSLGDSEKAFYYRPDHSEIWYTYVKCHSEQLLLKEFFDFQPRNFFDNFLKIYMIFGTILLKLRES